MFLWKFELKGNYKYKKYWYAPCKVSKWKAYQYISNEYPDETISSIGKINNKGNSYVNDRTTYLSNLFTEIDSLKKEAKYYYYQGWRETPGWGLHYKHLRAASTRLCNTYNNYPKILVANNS